MAEKKTKRVSRSKRASEGRPKMRRARADARPVEAAVPLLNGKVADLTGPRLTERWGVTCTDLGAAVVAPNGKLVSVFGDTFAGKVTGGHRSS